MRVVQVLPNMKNKQICETIGRFTAILIRLINTSKAGKGLMLFSNILLYLGHTIKN